MKKKEIEMHMIDIFEIDIIVCFSYEVKVPCTVDVQQSICARSLCFVANFASRFFDLSKKKQPSNLDGCLNKYLNFYFRFTVLPNKTWNY